MLKFLGLALLLASTVLAASLTPSPSLGEPELFEYDERIVGGYDVSITQHPHQVSMRYKSRNASAYSHTCGGSVFNNSTIITAAHCVRNRLAKNFIVVAGTGIRNGADGVVARVEKIIMHEKYNGSSYANDIALMILSTPLPLNGITIGTIKLATKVPGDGVKAVVTGWGTTSAGGVSSDKLLAVDVPIVSNDRCGASYGRERILESMLCAGVVGVGGKDACQGDSGGPLLVNRELAGVVSWGRGCALPDYPGIYANVPYFKDWIESNTATNEAYDFL